MTPLQEAQYFLNSSVAFTKPVIDTTDDGAVVLRWERGGIGVRCEFRGNGILEYSFKPKGGKYSSDVRELPLCSTLPTQIMREIERITELGRIDR